MFDFDEIEEDAQKTGGWKEGGSKESEAELSARITEAITKAGDDISAKERYRRQLVLPPIPSSPWIGVHRRNESALVRLYVALGVGAPAQSYAALPSLENYARYPDIEICVLELPGHGDNPPPAFYNQQACAEAVAQTIMDLQFHDQEDTDLPRPFALYGFSLGSMLMWYAARQVSGKCGERCLKLYVAGRGSPHIGVGAADSRQPELLSKPDLSSKPPDKVLEDTLASLSTMVDPPQVEKYRGYLGYLKNKDPRKLIDFAETLLCDSMVGLPALVDGDATSPRRTECPLQFWYSDADESWPLQNKGYYDNLPETWRQYAPEDGFAVTSVSGLGHGELGGPQSPLFDYVLTDLSKIAADIRK